jgi:tetratricopeptide (TPR) repeat protein
MLTMCKWEARIKTLGLAALAVLLLASCAPTGAKALVKGEQLIRQGEYEQAVKMLQRATATLPQNARAWNYLGLAYHCAQQPDKAVPAYQQALSLDRNLTAAYYNLGCLLLEQNNAAEATSRLTTFCVLEPASAEGWVKLGLAQTQARQPVPAANSFTNALRLRTRNPEAWNGLGMLQLQRNRPREALNCFTTASQQQSNYGPAILNEAIVYHQYLKNPATALQKYRAYLALRPSPPNALAVQATARQLEEELQPRPFLPPTNTNLQIALASNRPPTAANAAGRVAVAPPVSPLTTSLTGHAASVPSISTQKTEAPVNLAKANLPSTTSPSARTPRNQLKGNATPTVPPPGPASPAKPEPAKSQPAIPPAKTENEPTVERTTETVPAKPSPAVALVATNEPSTQIAKPAPPPMVVPPNAETNALIVEQATPTNAAPAAAPAAAAPPAKRNILQKVNPANWFKSQSKSRPPVTPLSPELRPAASSESPAASITASNSPTQLAQMAPLPQPVAPARYPYRSPSKPPAGNRPEAERYFALGIKAQKDGEMAAAVSAYQKATAADPAYFDAHYNLGLACYQSVRLPLALLEFELALAVDPSSFSARYDFALALLKANYPRDAANELEKLVRVAPEDTRVLLLLGNIYAQQLGQTASARRQYLKLLTLEPSHPQGSAIRYWLSENP